MEKDKKIEIDKKNTFHMILYSCPFCGEKNLKSIESIRNGDEWGCEMCENITMKMA